MEKFFMVDNRVIDEMRFENAVEFGVYMIILRFGNRGQIAYPSIEFMREKLRCSHRKISRAINLLEEKKLIEVIRKHRNCNRYRILVTTSETRSTKTEILSSLVEENKEKEINIEKRRKLLFEIYELISSGTGDNVFLIQQIFTGRGLTDEELEVMRDKIEASDFLMGKLEIKPTVRHYDSPKQIDKVRMGYYRNSSREKGEKRGKEETKPPYHYEFQEKEEVEYEPND
ncbi:MAG: helix-turn-helix domain-containing protein [Fusobacteriaceae bacterium]